MAAFNPRCRFCWKPIIGQFHPDSEPGIPFHPACPTRATAFKFDAFPRRKLPPPASRSRRPSLPDEVPEGQEPTPYGPRRKHEEPVLVH